MSIQALQDTLEGHTQYIMNDKGTRLKRFNSMAQPALMGCM